MPVNELSFMVQTSEELNEFIKELSKQAQMAASVFAKLCREMYLCVAPPKVVWLAFNHKKERVRKKNMARIQKYAKRLCLT